MKGKMIVGTRGSKLALIQTESIVNKLKSIHPGLEIDINKIVTSGDRDRYTHLDRIGTDVFVKELEEALLAGRVDLAVHSLKDVPTDIPRGLALIAVAEREDPRDVLVAKAFLNELPPYSRIGTGGLRRTVQITKMRPDLETCSIRGNVDTRLKKVDSGEIDGVILAVAGMKRLGWQDKITQYLPLENFLPAAGQGVLVIEARAEEREVINLVLPINDIPTWQCAAAERAFLCKLGGGCRAPIAALGTINGNILRLEGMVASPVGGKMLRDSIEGDVALAEGLGIRLAVKMIKLGALEFIIEASCNGIR